MRQYRYRDCQRCGRRRSRQARKVRRRSLESGLPTRALPDELMRERAVLRRLTMYGD